MRKRYTEADIQNASRQTDMQEDKDRTQDCDLAAGKETKLHVDRLEDFDADKVEMDEKYRCALCRQINRQTVMWVGRTIDRQTSRQA